MPRLLQDVLLGLSFFVVGVCVYMIWRHVVALWTMRHIWDVWFVLIYAGVANTVGLVGQLIWGAPNGIPLTWKAVSFALGLLATGVGMIGVAYSVGRHDKRATDKEGTDGTHRS